MRLDKFLKTSRIIKRRPIAKMVIDSGKAKINSKVAKAGTQIKKEDILELEYYNKFFKFQILEVPLGNVSKDKSGDLVKVLEVKELKIENKGN
ncbi:S4 domain-containing protein [Fusobacterium sp. MFO224]|uniref:S4 domain-containing protein n=1 Tax=Fusobacterium sp. MFO224 TaxID=3378070 RepID=UPI003851CE13